MRDTSIPKTGPAQRKLLESYGYHQGEIGECLEATCDTCGKACAGNRGWWKKVSYEHNEWDCTCRACALEYADFYETFDPNVFAEAESEVIAEEAKSHVIREKIGGAA